jgi:hypothetical protein
MLGVRLTFHAGCQTNMPYAVEEPSEIHAYRFRHELHVERLAFTLLGCVPVGFELLPGKH